MATAACVRLRLDEFSPPGPQVISITLAQDGPMQTRRSGAAQVKWSSISVITLIAVAIFFAGIGANPRQLGAAPKPKSAKPKSTRKVANSSLQTVQPLSVTSAFAMGWGYNFLFTTASGSPTSAGTDAIALDSAGNTIIAFNAYGIGNLDPAQSPAGAFQNTAGGHKAGFAKYDPSGNFLWMVPMISTGVSYARGIAVGPVSGDLYVVGDFAGACSFTTSAGTTLTVGTSTTPRTGFVARVEPSSGRIVWMDTTTINIGSQTCIFQYVACDAAENVYVTGSILGNCISTIDSGYGSGAAGLPLVVDNSASSSTTGCFVKFDKNGNGNWLRMGPATIAIKFQFSVDGPGNLYFTGYFSGTQDFDFSSATHNVTAIGSQDAFLEKLDPSGNFVWVKQFGQAASKPKGKNSIPAGTYYGAATGADGNGNIDFSLTGSNLTTVTAYGLTGNLFQFDTNGNARWAASVSGTATLFVHTPFPFCLDGANDVYLGAFGVANEFSPSGTQVQSVPFHAGTQVDHCAADAGGNFVWGGYAVDGTGSTNVTGQANVSPTSTPYWVPAWTGSGFSSVLVVRWNRQ
ncbi:MAG: hypothetical protein HY290_22325 [Planctomycetia bacterium]|nr:hypothetical protein [Planctomycetia bacterium]